MKNCPEPGLNDINQSKPSDVTRTEMNDGEENGTVMTTITTSVALPDNPIINEQEINPIQDNVTGGTTTNISDGVQVMEKISFNMMNKWNIKEIRKDYEDFKKRGIADRSMDSDSESNTKKANTHNSSASTLEEGEDDGVDMGNN
ncbi:unnamed protein product [Adineta steineri]|uniref:Uncharacterized protein n=1 Tax=Adineta steineri TaxID=433720 RepID=A0A813V8P0_9BILA|nr:unnamed protein product [Adineta steineri]CAF0944190.1 unnamed protein product [Adineta steineri]CAF0978077.1 unnamed protein product [Adineta steineri]